MSSVLCLIAAALAVPTLAFGDPAAPSTLTEILEALATQDRAIETGRTRLRDTAAAADAATAAYTAADRAMQERVAAEVRRHPALAGQKYMYYTAGMAADVAGTIAARRARLAELRTALATITREEDNLRLMGRTEPHRLRPFLEYGIALLEGNIRWLDLLADSLGRTEEARATRERDLRGLRERVTALKNAEQALRDAQRERFRLLHRIGTEFAPIHVRSVSVSLDGDPRASDAWSYQASVTQPAVATEMDREIRFLLEALADAQTELIRHRDEFLAAEQRFADVGRRLDAAHAAHTGMVERAYYLRIGQELADSTIGIIKDGGQPVGIYFEAGWRLVEYAATDDYRIPEPRIDESLAAYRDDVAQRLSQFIHLPAEARLLNDEQWLNEHAAVLLGRAEVFATTGERIAAHIRGDQADEFVKAAWNTGIVDGIKGFAHVAVVQGWRPDTFKGFLNSRLFKEYFDPNKYINTASDAAVGAFEPRLPAGLARWLRGGDATEDLLRPRRSAMGEFARAKVKDVALGAAVTAAKEVINAAQQDAMLESATSLALLDIEWFVRRYEYSVRGSIYHGFGRQLAEAEAAIGALFEQKAREAPTRTFLVEAEETISTTDALRIRVQFSDGVDEARIVAGSREFVQQVDRQALVEWRVPAQVFAPGQTTLAITAKSRRLGTESSFDADPTTAAHYPVGAETSTHPGGGFVGCEPGADQRHRLSFAAPTLTITNPKPGGYLPGDWLDLTCDLPGSLGRRRMLVTAYPVQRPVEIVLTPGASATTRFPAPTEAGSYRMLLLTPNQPTEHAAAPFVVALRLAREIGRGSFVRLDSLPLADRGPTFTVTDTPIPAGLGRMAFETRDAADQIVNASVSIRAPGSDTQLTYTYGGNALDLAPGAYDVLVGGAVPTLLRSLSVSAGKTSLVRTGGQGRLTFNTQDALGQPSNPRISVRRAGSDVELTYTYGGNQLDLPPGSYDVAITAVPAIEHRGVPVEAGRETLLTSGGYGRLRLDALDALSQPVTPRVDIRRSGEKDLLTYTYGGNLVDLPPGRYDVSYTYTPPIEFTAIAVEAGKVATRTAGGYGRLQLDALDALGQPITPRVDIRRAGEKDLLTYTYGGNFVDLPPGRYDVSYTYTPPIEFTAVAVEAGKVATRTAGGYGRLQIDTFNTRGERADLRVSIRRPGADSEFTYTYGNHAIDLPPGGYVCVIGYGDAEVRASVSVAKGTTTATTLRAR